ncbi:MAG: hypothetical protein ACI9LM_003555 [Alteromonadaceae bacterium]|jgi:hypothetical protein
MQSSILMCGSIFLALVVAKFGFIIIEQYLSAHLALVNRLSVELITFVSALLLLLFFTLIFAKLAIKTINYHSLNSLLITSGKGTGVQVSKRIRQLLVISQIAVATLLVFINISLFEGAVKSINQPLGFNEKNINYLTLSAVTAQYPEDESITPIMADIKTKLIQLPSVDSISQSPSPFSNFHSGVFTTIANNKHYNLERMFVDLIFRTCFRNIFPYKHHLNSQL